MLAVLFCIIRRAHYDGTTSYSEASEQLQIPDVYTHIALAQEREAKTKSMITDITPTSNAILYLAPLALASSAATTAGLTFLPSFHRMRGGGARLRRPSRERTRTTTKI